MLQIHANTIENGRFELQNVVNTEMAWNGRNHISHLNHLNHASIAPSQAQPRRQRSGAGLWAQDEQRIQWIPGLGDGTTDEPGLLGSVHGSSAWDAAKSPRR